MPEKSVFKVFSAAIRFLRWVSCRKPVGRSLFLPCPPFNCEVEVDPEEDVDDEKCNKRNRDPRDVSLSLQLQPDVAREHKAKS